jgi:hypothetical protein
MQEQQLQDINCNQQLQCSLAHIIDHVQVACQLSQQQYQCMMSGPIQ